MGAVELRHRAVEQLLVPRAERVDAVDRARRIVLEVLDHLVDGRSGHDALGDLAHRVLDAMELVPSPGVRLVEVERDAVEVARVQRVAVPADGITLVGVRRVLLDEVAPERGVRLGRTGRQLAQPGAERVVAEVRRVVARRSARGRTAARRRRRA